jgi:hypothetical protein
MKRILFVLLFTVFCLSQAEAIDFRIFEMRNKIFDESKEIKTALLASKNSFVLVTMFDSCIQVTSQLDAYFYMLSLFNAIRRPDLTITHTDILLSWLTEIKRTNELCIQSLNSVSPPLEPRTLFHIKKVQKLFSDLNTLIDEELAKVSVISKTVKKKK